MSTVRISGIAELQGFLQSVPPQRWRSIDLAPASQGPQPVPSFVFGAIPAALNPQMYSEFTIGPVGCHILEGFCVLADGIMADGDTALANVTTNHPAGYISTILATLPSLPIRNIPGTVTNLCGPGQGVYGHWLVDFLPRLHVLSQAGFDPDLQRYLVQRNRPNFVDQLLLAFGIKPDQLVEYDGASELVRVERLLVPSNLRRGPRIHPSFKSAAAFLTGRSGVTAMRAGAGTKLFVVRRGDGASRTLTNRGEIEALAESQGYDLIDPAPLPIKDQIRLFGSAATIAGEYGSGLHGSIFAASGTVVCALRGTAAHPGFIQTELTAVLNQKVGYVLGVTPPDAIEQSFAVSADDVRRGLDCCTVLAAPHGAS